MRALLIDHNAPNHLRLGEAPDPVPGAAEVVIQVVGTSLNRGEVAFRAPAADEGTVLGWDASGIVVKRAVDGSGPAEGTAILTVDGEEGDGPSSGQSTPPLWRLCRMAPTSPPSPLCPWPGYPRSVPFARWAPWKGAGS